MFHTFGCRLIIIFYSDGIVNHTTVRKSLFFANPVICSTDRIVLGHVYTCQMFLHWNGKMLN